MMLQCKCQGDLKGKQQYVAWNAVSFTCGTYNCARRSHVREWLHLLLMNVFGLKSGKNISYFKQEKEGPEMQMDSARVSVLRGMSEYQNKLLIEKQTTLSLGQHAKINYRLTHKQYNPSMDAMPYFQTTSGYILCHKFRGTVTSEHSAGFLLLIDNE